MYAQNARRTQTYTQTHAKSVGRTKPFLETSGCRTLCVYVYVYICIVYIYVYSDVHTNPPRETYEPST